MTELDLLGHLEGVQADFLRTLRDVDPSTAVPWCGAWRVRDLADHLARVHHWAAAHVRGGPEEPLGEGPSDLQDLYRTCAAELREVLGGAGPEAPCLTLVGPGRASFWRRRQLHETLVHLWDLRTAGGLGLAVAPEVWADTVDEVVTVMQPRQVHLGRMPRLPSAIELVATDAGRTWRLDTADDGPPAVSVRGSAAELALLLWGRRTVEDARAQVSGDADVLADALAQGLTP
ncbi:maleylpyruvate isomerase family mycothiol-dependent enzyme [Actinotalea sp. K2]|uniref:maleylpyruvate isomerase family mycothiol-dependent enzyme n=1 Tax=Actinotalea sp. K2 TaxID=2939438 RepID=UPI00201723DA|nr:maleylpyruvate isomerase family mycothiol-dependent enzyme [Actinotalea sp. K2]MCL3859743.1 maleylpyruvate isomerase family mycothiol-dependent enzyme [Actinotalea sp. K2]